jgi:pSer/pThr/pTyr-binding forkhead associated (FHA) protein
LTTTKPLYLEIIEGPGAGLKVPLRRPCVIGRDQEADLVLDNIHTSRMHARVSPSADGRATVSDLNSSEGTFVNQVQIHSPTEIGPGDELLCGLTVFMLRTAADIDEHPTAVRPVPPVLAVPPTAPRYIAPQAQPDLAHVPQLDRLRDAQVKLSARTAPLAVLVLVALAVAVYLGSR